ncbi:MAG: hypothetical protein JW891_14635 [Candidatus Lokiarchaeota archaeon]|nr:hypothetical protein [Candidatus Lokiarchaeota archaeon]
MKFKLDENIPFILKGIIESTGNHEVDSVFHENITGIIVLRLKHIKLGFDEFHLLNVLS